MNTPKESPTLAEIREHYDLDQPGCLEFLSYHGIWNQSVALEYYLENPTDELDMGKFSYQFRWGSDILSVLTDDKVEQSTKYTILLDICGATWNDIDKLIYLPGFLDEPCKCQLVESLPTIPWNFELDKYLANTCSAGLAHAIMQRLVFESDDDTPQKEDGAYSFKFGPSMSMIPLSSRSASIKSGFEKAVKDKNRYVQASDLDKPKRSFEPRRTSSSAHAVNTWQEEKIFGINTDHNGYESMIETPHGRTLVFYFRGAYQGTHDEHCLQAIRDLDTAMKNDEFELYTQLKVVCRRPGLARSLQKEFPDIEVVYERGILHRKELTMYADTIHPNHGSPESTPGTCPILGTAVTCDPEKMEHLHDSDMFTKLDLLYYGGDNHGTVQKYVGEEAPEFPQNMSPEKASKTIIKTAKRNELRLMSLAGVRSKKLTGRVLSSYWNILSYISRKSN